MSLVKLIEEFMRLVARSDVEIYNEFSLQHELGIFLRATLPDSKVEFERNINHFKLRKKDFIKKEMDISISDRNSGELWGVVELKYPRNGQVPEQMYSFCKDISFIEQMVQAGIKMGAFVAVVDDPLFYSGNSEGIYSMFRSEALIHGKITKPTGAKNSQVYINGAYHAMWNDITNKSKWCCIEVNNK